MTIRPGTRGEHVATLQRFLISCGYLAEGQDDGVWGGVSAGALVEFQRSYRLEVDGVPGPATLAAVAASGGLSPLINGGNEPPEIIQHARGLGLETWEEPWRLWLYGIRSPSRTAGSFDDELGCCFVDSAGLWNHYRWPGTTDPGSYYLTEPLNSLGCAILVEGQYLDTWTIDLHGGKYEALCQRAGEVTVYRDDSKDDKLDLDPETMETGWFGINIHAATQTGGAVSTQVGRWSAGCQVHASADGFAEMMRLAHQQVEETGRGTFSYTLADKW